MQYKIIADYRIDVFLKLMNDNLKEGWMPQGGISVVAVLSNSNLPVQQYTQAVIRHEEVDV